MAENIKMQIYHKIFCLSILLKVASPGMRLNENHVLRTCHHFCQNLRNITCPNSCRNTVADGLKMTQAAAITGSNSKSGKCAGTCRLQPKGRRQIKSAPFSHKEASEANIWPDTSESEAQWELWRATKLTWGNGKPKCGWKSSRHCSVKHVTHKEGEVFWFFFFLLGSWIGHIEPKRQTMNQTRLQKSKDKGDFYSGRDIVRILIKLNVNIY